MSAAIAGLGTALPDARLTNADATACTDDDEWRTRLVDHLVHPVLWRQSLDTLVDLGADTFLEIGPGRVLTGLARKCRPDVATELVEVSA